MRNIPRLSKEQIKKMQLDDKQYAIKLVSKYFSQVIPKDYKYKQEIFVEYEEIAKRYAILEVQITHKNKINKLSLITLIKGL